MSHNIHTKLMGGGKLKALDVSSRLEIKIGDIMAEPSIKMRDKDGTILFVNKIAQSITDKNDRGLTSSMDNVTHFLTDREKRKKAYERLGVTSDTPDNYRLVTYKDDFQTIAFIGHMEGDKFVADKKKVLSHNKEEQAILDLFLLGANGQAEFQDLPKEESKRITFTVDKDTKAKDVDGKGVDIQLSPEEQKKLGSKISLVASAGDITPSANSQIAAQEVIAPKTPVAKTNTGKGV